MSNKKTVALTVTQYREIIYTIQHGFEGCRPNKQIATILVLEANLGIRVSDIIGVRSKGIPGLKLNSIVKDGSRYRLDIKEIKTGKSRTFTVKDEVYDYIKKYCLENNIKPDEQIFKITQRTVQSHIQKTCKYLGYPNNISTHSFRKFFATEMYTNNNYNIILVQKLLQHSSAAVTQRYIGISPYEIENALNNHSYLM